MAGIDWGGTGRWEGDRTCRPRFPFHQLGRQSKAGKRLEEDTRTGQSFVSFFVVGDNECVWRPMESILWKGKMNCARERWVSQQGRRSVCTDATGTLEFPQQLSAHSRTWVGLFLGSTVLSMNSTHKCVYPKVWEVSKWQSSVGHVDSPDVQGGYEYSVHEAPHCGDGDRFSERTGLAWTSSLHPPSPHFSMPCQEIWEFQTESHLLDHYKGIFVETGACNVFWCNNCELLL